MEATSIGGWEGEIERWLAPFLARLRRKAQRRWAPFYLKGLILPGERKSVEPMAARVAPGDTQQLHHFVSTSPWATASLEDELVKAADRLVGGPGAVLVVDDTALVKQGRLAALLPSGRGEAAVLRSARQAGQLPGPGLAHPGPGRGAGLRRPAAILARGLVRRCRTAVGVPEAIAYRPKWRITLDEVDRVLASGARFGCGLADAEYGKAAEFRHGLDDRQLIYAVGILPTQKVYPPDVALSYPERKATGRPRKHPVPSVASIEAAALIEARPEGFRTISWRAGTKGPLKAEFAALRVRVADGQVAARAQHLPGEEAWLVGEHRATGERKYYLANHPADTPLEVLAALIKSRWVCEQMHQQLKDKLGLDHFEGRSWCGLHHHTLLCQLAFAFLQHLRLGGKKRRYPARPRPATPAYAAGGAPLHPRRAHPGPAALPPLPATLRPSPPPLNLAG